MIPATRFVHFLAVLPLLVAAAPAPAQDAPVILRPSTMVLADGSLLEGGAVLLRGARILAVGRDVPAPANAVVVELEGVLAAGFVDAFARGGVDGGLAEESRFATPELRVADAIDYDSRDWRRWAEHGITAVHLVPDPRNRSGRDPLNVVAGWSCVVSCLPDGPTVLRTTARQALVALSTGSDDSQGGPTSLAGSLELLDRLLPRHANQLGARGALAFVDSAEGVSGIRALGEAHAFDTAWIAWGDPGSYGGRLRDGLVGVPALGSDSATPRALETLRRLHAAGATVVFGTRQADGRSAPSSLRRSAMAYARATGDPAAALASITSAASDYAGMKPPAGRLASGARADLVLWSGHPLDAASSIRSVMIAGRTVSGPGSSREAQ